MVIFHSYVSLPDGIFWHWTGMTSRSASSNSTCKSWRSSLPMENPHRNGSKWKFIAGKCWEHHLTQWGILPWLPVGRSFMIIFCYALRVLVSGLPTKWWFWLIRMSTFFEANCPVLAGLDPIDMLKSPCCLYHRFGCWKEPKKTSSIAVIYRGSKKMCPKVLPKWYCS